MEIEPRLVWKILKRTVALVGFIIFTEQVSAQTPTLEISQYCASPHDLAETAHLYVWITGFNIPTDPFGVWTIWEDPTGKRVISNHDFPGTPYSNKIYRGLATSIFNDKDQPGIEFQAGQSYKVSLNRVLSREDFFNSNPPLGERITYTEFTASSCEE